jgi:hypothetical protein
VNPAEIKEAPPTPNALAYVGVPATKAAVQAVIIVY